MHNWYPVLFEPTFVLKSPLTIRISSHVVFCQPDLEGCCKKVPVSFTVACCVCGHNIAWQWSLLIFGKNLSLLIHVLSGSQCWRLFLLFLSIIVPTPCWCWPSVCPDQHVVCSELMVKAPESACHISQTPRMLMLYLSISFTTFAVLPVLYIV